MIQHAWKWAREIPRPAFPPIVEVLDSTPWGARWDRQSYYRSTKLASLQETRLDDRYTLARTEWQWQFAPSGDAPTELTLPSTFIVDRSGSEPRIVLYMMHHDIARLLKEHGLISAP